MKVVISTILVTCVAAVRQSLKAGGNLRSSSYEGDVYPPQEVCDTGTIFCSPEYGSTNLIADPQRRFDFYRNEQVSGITGLTVITSCNNGMWDGLMPTCASIVNQIVFKIGNGTQKTTCDAPSIPDAVLPGVDFAVADGEYITEVQVCEDTQSGQGIIGGIIFNTTKGLAKESHQFVQPGANTECALADAEKSESATNNWRLVTFPTAPPGEKLSIVSVFGTGASSLASIGFYAKLVPVEIAMDGGNTGKWFVVSTNGGPTSSQSISYTIGETWSKTTTNGQTSTSSKTNSFTAGYKFGDDELGEVSFSETEATTASESYQNIVSDLISGEKSKTQSATCDGQSVLWQYSVVMTSKDYADVTNTYDALATYCSRGTPDEPPKCPPGHCGKQIDTKKCACCKDLNWLDPKHHQNYIERGLLCAHHE